jgi:hypothetical protein
MNPRFLRSFSLVSLIFMMAGACTTRAQAPLEPAQLPSRTTFYLIWRGAPASEARTANSLLALWDDPDFAPVRSALASGILSSSGEKSSQPKLTPQELGEMASLLENSFTLGYISKPAKHRVASPATPSDAKPPAWNGLFFVYNRAGKEALLSQAILRLRSSEKEAPRLSQLMIGGIPVLKAEHKSGASYWAENGKYAIATSEPAVMEDLLARIANPSLRSGSLAQSAAYKEAQPIVGSGLLEFFLRIPDLRDLAEDSNAGQFKVRPLLDAARLDAVHSMSGHVTFEGSKTHVQAAILGDMAPGTPFDIWMTGQPAPASLALVPADAVSYHSTQFNLLGIYDTVKRIARSVFPVGQAGNADLIDTIAEKRLGMPLGDALGLFTGEIASMQTSPSLDSAKRVFFFGIRRKPETLKLFRAVFGDQLTSERNESDTTFLKISLGGNQGNAGVAQWNFFNVAVTPDMVIGASRVETLREVLANRAKTSASAGLAGTARFLAGRSQFPATLDGFSFFDFQKVDWQAAKDRWMSEARKPSVANSAAGSNPAATSKVPDWLSQLDPRVLSRHLHSSWSATWKDAKGVHWDQWIE